MHFYNYFTRIFFPVFARAFVWVNVIPIKFFRELFIHLIFFIKKKLFFCQSFSINFYAKLKFTHKKKWKQSVSDFFSLLCLSSLNSVFSHGSTKFIMNGKRKFCLFLFNHAGSNYAYKKEYVITYIAVFFGKGFFGSRTIFFFAYYKHCAAHAIKWPTVGGKMVGRHMTNTFSLGHVNFASTGQLWKKILWKM